MNLDERKQILNSVLEEYGVENELHPGGKIYQAALKAMFIVGNTIQPGIEENKPSEDIDLINKIILFQKTKLSQGIYMPYVHAKQLVMKRLQEESVQPAENEPVFEPPYSGHGSIIGNLFEFCKFKNGATYTEMNMFYLGKTPETYNSHNDRGGSFVHHLESMRENRKRRYNGKYVYVEKRGKKWFTVESN